MADLLVGKDEILDYLRRADWRSVRKLIREKGFPAVKVLGRWESSCRAIDEWRSAHFDGDVR